VLHLESFTAGAAADSVIRYPAITFGLTPVTAMPLMGAAVKLEIGTVKLFELAGIEKAVTFAG
jgi:hypothetical protein